MHLGVNEGLVCKYLCFFCKSAGCAFAVPPPQSIPQSGGLEVGVIIAITNQSQLIAPACFACSAGKPDTGINDPCVCPLGDGSFTYENGLIPALCRLRTLSHVRADVRRFGLQPDYESVGRAYDLATFCL